MPISFVAKVAKAGRDPNGKKRRIIIIPTNRVREVTEKYEGNQLKITLEEI